MKNEPSLGETNPKSGLKLRKVSMASYEPNLKDCCDVLGTTKQLESSKDAWQGIKPGVGNGYRTSNTY